MAPNILVVLTSHSQLGNTGKQIGWYLPELAHPYYILQKAGATFTIASPAGGKAPLSPDSIEMFKDDKESQDFLKEEHLWSNTEKLSNFVGKAGQFDAVLIPGGHGRKWHPISSRRNALIQGKAMFDLATDTTSQQIIREFYESGKVVAAVCHGPASLVNVKLSDGSYLVNGEPISAFTNTEEEQVGLASAMPFALETELEKHGAKIEKVEPWKEKVVVAGKGGRLITGQNPASAAGLGKAIVNALSA